MTHDNLSARRQVGTDMVAAATELLGLLDSDQRRIGLGAAPTATADDEERRRWFYTPTDHGGLTMHQLRPAQQRAVMALVSTGLSPAGYVTVATVMGLENILDRDEGFVASLGRERGRDPGLFQLRVFGTPGLDGAWGWRFGGHHLSLNNLVLDGVLVSTTRASWVPTRRPHPCWAARRTGRWHGWRTPHAT